MPVETYEQTAEQVFAPQSPIARAISGLRNAFGARAARAVERDVIQAGLNAESGTDQLDPEAHTDQVISGIQGQIRSWVEDRLHQLVSNRQDFERLQPHQIREIIQEAQEVFAEMPAELKQSLALVEAKMDEMLQSVQASGERIEASQSIHELRAVAANTRSATHEQREAAIEALTGIEQQAAIVCGMVEGSKDSDVQQAFREAALFKVLIGKLEQTGAKGITSNIELLLGLSALGESSTLKTLCDAPMRNRHEVEAFVAQVENLKEDIIARIGPGAGPSAGTPPAGGSPVGGAPMPGPGGGGGLPYPNPNRRSEVPIPRGHTGEFMGIMWRDGKATGYILYPDVLPMHLQQYAAHFESFQIPTSETVPVVNAQGRTVEQRIMQNVYLHWRAFLPKPGLAVMETWFNKGIQLTPGLKIPGYSLLGPIGEFWTEVLERAGTTPFNETFSRAVDLISAYLLVQTGKALSPDLLPNAFSSPLEYYAITAIDRFVRNVFIYVFDREAKLTGRPTNIKQIKADQFESVAGAPLSAADKLPIIWANTGRQASTIGNILYMPYATRELPGANPIRVAVRHFLNFTVHKKVFFCAMDAGPDHMLLSHVGQGIRPVSAMPGYTSPLLNYLIDAQKQRTTRLIFKPWTVISLVGWLGFQIPTFRQVFEISDQTAITFSRFFRNIVMFQVFNIYTYFRGLAGLGVWGLEQVASGIRALQRWTNSMGWTNFDVPNELVATPQPGVDPEAFKMSVESGSMANAAMMGDLPGHMLPFIEGQPFHMATNPFTRTCVDTAAKVLDVSKDQILGCSKQVTENRDVVYYIEAIVNGQITQFYSASQELSQLISPNAQSTLQAQGMMTRYQWMGPEVHDALRDLSQKIYGMRQKPVTVVMGALQTVAGNGILQMQTVIQNMRRSRGMRRYKKQVAQADRAPVDIYDGLENGNDYY